MALQDILKAFFPPIIVCAILRMHYGMDFIYMAALDIYVPMNPPPLVRT
jgi:hypothetical protein